jgi:hypothetical protein
MGMNLGSPNARIIAVLFGLVLSAVAAVALTAAVQDASALDWLTGAAMLAAGFWIISIGVVGIPVASGRFVGGGPYLPRVRLMVGEAVQFGDSASYLPGRGRISSIAAFTNRHQGEVFVTDRRIIFIPTRFTPFDRPTWVAISEVVAVTASDRPSVGVLRRKAFDVETRTGRKYVFWPSSADFLSRLTAVLASGNIPAFADVPAAPPRPWLLVGAEIAIGTAILLAVVLLLAGSSHPPFVHRPDNLVSGILAFAVASWGAGIVATVRARILRRV